MAELRFDTKKIKAGYSPLDNNLAISPPIYQTAAYDFKSTEHAQNLFTYKEAGYLYTRVGNPTVNYFAERVKALDGAKNAVAVGSGMAAISYTLLNLAVGGGTILASPYVYGGTSLTAGADCSGFVQSIFAGYGISLPRTAQEPLSFLFVKGEL